MSCCHNFEKDTQQSGELDEMENPRKGCRHIRETQDDTGLSTAFISVKITVYIFQQRDHICAHNNSHEKGS